MASSQPGNIISKKAKVAMTATDYRFVIAAINDECDVCGANGKAIGIRENSPAIGGMAKIIESGTAKLTLAGGITIGDMIKSDAAGACVLADTDKDQVRAEAMETGVAGDVIEVKLVAYKASI